MKALTTYLNFDGDACEAMTFYKKCLDKFGVSWMFNCELPKTA
ncbi:MAG: hypothetical protein WD802_06215 [Gemmatimonadaceae bacterium]